MNAILGQLILAAKKDDFEGWMQILVFVAMIVVYSLSSILKAKRKKTEPEEGKEKPQPPRSAGPFSRPQYQEVAQPQRRKITRPQPAAQKIATKTERPVRMPATKRPVKLGLPISLQAQPGLIETPKFEVKAQKPPEVKHISPVVVTEAHAAMYLDGILLDYSDPDELKRAILHYEILGKPLSLRKPSDSFF